MANDTLVYSAVKDMMASHGLNLKIVVKQQSRFMKACNFFVKKFNPEFMTGFTTTIPFLNTMYVPDSWDDGTEWRTLAHESIHALQAKQEGQLVFALKYMFPQCLGPLALFAIGAFWWTPMLFALVFLAALAPWPAKWRIKYEREAYRVSGAMDHLIGWNILSSMYVSYMRNHYTGWSYYKMSWGGVETIDIVADMVHAGFLADSNYITGGGATYEQLLTWSVKSALEKK